MLSVATAAQFQHIRSHTSYLLTLLNIWTMYPYVLPDPKVRFARPTVLIPNPTTSFQALLPELELCIKISGVSWDIGRLAYKIRSRVVDAHPKGTLPEPGQTCLRRLADYVTCAADTILAYHEIFRGIRVAITSTDTSLDSDVLAIYERYDDFLRMQDVLASLEGPVMQSLHGLGEYVIQEFSYPPGIHFFVMRVLGPDSWGCREIALQEVPPLLDASRMGVIVFGNYPQRKTVPTEVA